MSNACGQKPTTKPDRPPTGPPRTGSAGPGRVVNEQPTRK
jgi:hypothetical protein